jgi:hypothetical protein
MALCMLTIPIYIGNRINFKDIIAHKSTISITLDPDVIQRALNPVQYILEEFYCKHNVGVLTYWHPKHKFGLIIG